MNKTDSRLPALDGLRGFAIILVFLNHIPTFHVLSVLPSAIFSWIFVNGVTGVTFLFILSGFLMYYIYPNPQGLRFIQKRYTRIFPLFFTMCAVMWTQRQFPNAPWYFLLLILFVYPTVTHFIWMNVFKKIPQLFSKMFFLSFLCLQVIVGLFYVFWINKHTFIVFNHILPTFIREGTIFLVNLTLTLPLGQYVPMLDGVYWTLVAEVLFYVLYPYVVTPLIAFVSGSSAKVKVLFLISLFFLFGGIHMLSYKIFILSLVQPALFFYFVIGILLAHIYKYHTKIITSVSQFFTGKLFIVPFILAFLTVMTINDLSFLGQVISPWVRMSFAIPITFLVGLMLSRETILYKIFASRWLRFIGMVSYSMYLCHSLVIGIAKSFYLPSNLPTDIVFILITFGVTCCISYFLFLMVEKPYFAKTKQVKKKVVALSRKTILPVFVPFAICGLYLISVFAGFQSENGYSFFSYVTSISQDSFSNPRQAVAILLPNAPIILSIYTSANNLGLISLKLFHKTKVNQTIPQALNFKLFDQNARRLEDATYSLDQFDNGPTFPFGFPTIADSKGKVYRAQFSLTNPLSKDTVSLYETTATVVYASNKKELFTHPVQLGMFVWSKLITVISTIEARLTFILLLPFLLMTFFLAFGRKRIFRYN